MEEPHTLLSGVTHAPPPPVVSLWIEDPLCEKMEGWGKKLKNGMKTGGGKGQANKHH
jgi:hypothetical protein